MAKGLDCVLAMIRYDQYMNACKKALTMKIYESDFDDESDADDELDSFDEPDSNENPLQSATSP
jgi:hypothetical protein